MAVLYWLGFQPKHSKTEPTKQALSISELSSYLLTEGAEILVPTKSELVSAPLHLQPGARLALTGESTYLKHYFCDWVLGFTSPEKNPKDSVQIRIKNTEVPNRSVGSILGRSPLLYGETIQESLLYRTQNVKKADLYSFIERLYGPSLRARTNPKNPLFDINGKPVPTQMLTAREHVEIAQINLILQKSPLVVLDLSSELMAEALADGFRPARELTENGRTLIVILPAGKTTAWAEEILGLPFSSSLTF